MTSSMVAYTPALLLTKTEADAVDQSKVNAANKALEVDQFQQPFIIVDGMKP